MKKSELKYFIHIYAEIEKALLNRSETAEIRRNRKVERIEIKPWMYKLPEYLGMLERAESVIVKDIIEENIRKGKSDQKVLQLLPVSESTYYRWKKQILDKIYELYILSNDITAEEILSERIE